MVTPEPPSPEPTAIGAFWGRFCATLGIDPDQPHEAWSFGDTPEMAEELLALVLSGRKRATAAAVPDLKATGDPIPKSGDLSVILDGQGRPACVIRTEAVEIRPFHAVDADFAAAEGEGDGTLAHWRDGHAWFFRRRAEAVGFTFHEGIDVVCERFALIYSER